MRTEIKSIFARKAMTLVLALLTTATAWADETIYTITILPGEGTGEAFTVQSTTIISRADLLARNYDQSHGCFVLDTDGNTYYVLPNYCPFTAPEGKEFDQWEASFGGTHLGGFMFDVATYGSFTITALYKDVVTASVTFTMPDEIEVEYGHTETAFDIRVESVTFGDNSKLYIRLYDGTFSCDAHNATIPFTMTTNGNEADRGSDASGDCGCCFLYPYLAYPYTCQGFIHISSDDLASAKPGSYTATLRYRYRWLGPKTDIEGTIPLTLTVPGDPYIVLADDADNAERISSYDNRLCTVTIEGRTLYTDGDWNTLCLPFSVPSLSGTPLDGFTVMELDGQTSYLADGTLTLNFTAATSIEAGKPYIVKKLDTTETNASPQLTATSGTAGEYTQENYDKLVDRQNGASHIWRTPSASAFCEFNTSEAFLVTHYTLTTSSSSVQGDPTVWTLKARLTESDDWTVIDSRNASTNPDDALPGGRTEGKNYTAQNPGTYRYFRFEVEQTGGASFMHLNELALHSTVLTPVNVADPTFEGVTINAAAPQPVVSSDGTVAFTGSYSPVSFPGEDRSILFLGAENTPYYPNAAMTLGSCRAHFQLNGITAGDPAAGVRAFVLSFDDMDGATGIISVNGSASTVHGSDAWYTLSGVRLSGKPTAKGIYINNGRKFVIK